MIKKLLVIFCVITINSLFSQSELRGIVHYESTYSQQNIDNYFKNKRKTMKDKKMIRLTDDMFLKSKKVASTLQFTLKEAIFEVSKKISIKDRGSIIEKFSSFTAGGPEPYYTSSVTKTLEKQNCESLDECFIITSKFIKWNLTQETKKIAGYLCYKAISKVKRNNTFVEVIAWYTPQIPVNFGPMIYNGLPGLILDLDDGIVHFRTAKLELNPKKGIKIKPLKKGKRVSEIEFNKMSEEAFSKL